MTSKSSGDTHAPSSGVCIKESRTNKQTSDKLRTRNCLEKTAERQEKKREMEGERRETTDYSFTR